MFGCGDQVGYGEIYCDAAGELHDCMQKQGATMFGYVDIAKDGAYIHTGSKSDRDGKFIGMMCAQVNQADETERRVKAWIEQL